MSQRLTKRKQLERGHLMQVSHKGTQGTTTLTIIGPRSRSYLHVAIKDHRPYPALGYINLTPNVRAELVRFLSIKPKRSLKGGR